MPIVAAFQSALNTGMLLPSERGTYYFAFDMKQLLKGDILKRYQAYRIALQSRFMQPNEVRYEEDFEPYEYDFITLGLSDVLLDLKNKTIYTPNTNQTVKFGEAAVQKNIDNQTSSAIIEDRYNDGSNYTKDEHGRFTGSTGTGGGSGGGGGSSGGGLAKTDLTDDEAAALNSYVSSESYKINEKLRSGAKLTDDEQRMVDNLDSALQKMPKYEGIVYRSLDSSVMSNPEEFWKIHTPNRIVNYKSFTSSSTSVYDKNMNIQMIIKSKNGKDIRGYNSNEQEILFGRNSVFKVTNVINNTIYMEEV